MGETPQYAFCIIVYVKGNKPCFDYILLSEGSNGVFNNNVMQLHSLIRNFGCYTLRRLLMGFYSAKV